ncbi:MAG: hypothetical protein HQK49_04150 [Oligoflexia bacterium]|nr:hypothetical protein [Oligoflexia bacterium]
MLKSLAFLFVLLLLSLSFLNGCKSKPQDFVDKANWYADHLPGMEIPHLKLIKTTAANPYSTFAVIQELDGGTYIACNFANYKKGTILINNYFDSLKEDVDIFYDLTPVGDGTFTNSSGLIFEETMGSSKDLETMGYLLEDLKIQKMGQAFSSNLSLSEERGIEVAKLITHWNHIKTRRAITDSDYNSFSNKLLGFNIQDATNAYQALQASGDKTKLEAFFKKAATTNQTTPENIERIFKEMVESY